MRDIVLNT